MKFMVVSFVNKIFVGLAEWLTTKILYSGLFLWGSIIFVIVVASPGVIKYYTHKNFHVDYELHILLLTQTTLRMPHHLLLYLLHSVHEVLA